MFVTQLDLNYSFLLFQLLDFSNTGKIWGGKGYIGTFLIPEPRQIDRYTYAHAETRIHTYRLNKPFLL